MGKMFVVPNELVRWEKIEDIEEYLPKNDGNPDYLGITDIIVSEGVEYIAKGVFEKFTALRSIAFPKSLKEINGSLGLSETLESVEFSEGIEKIGRSAFHGYSSLKKVKIPSTIIEIGRCAFYHTSLEEVELNEGVEIIGSDAFDYTKITSLRIPSTVKQIGDLPTQYGPGPAIAIRCENLTSIVVDSNNPYYDSRENCNAIIRTETGELINGCNTTVIPNSVKVIAKQAFDGYSKLQSVNLPEGLTKISPHAFNGCESLTEIVIPDGVTEIGEYAFARCQGLRRVVISNSVEEIGESAFAYCPEMRTMVIPKSVQKIGKDAFSQSNKLEDVTVPKKFIKAKYFNKNIVGLDIFNKNVDVPTKKKETTTK